MSAYSAEQLAAIRAAIAKGEKTVQYADRSVTYRSIAELIDAERIIAADVEGSAPKTLLGRGSKGA